jgi:multidrug efflux pump subunit AcrB
MKIKHKEFIATSWAIDNRTSIYVAILFIVVIGMMSYLSIPKELFPEIVIPTVFVNTPYPGTSPEDMENLVTRPLEKQLKSITGVKEITSNSVQDFSMIMVEFTTDVKIADAKQMVKDAVDKARSDLPTDLPSDPTVMEIEFSEFPIMYINLSGNYDLVRLKKYAEEAQDRIESLKEITRVDIVGALDREIQIDVDMYKMHAASVTLGDIERSVASENLTISGGNLTTYGMKRSIRVVGQFTSPQVLKNLVIQSSSGALVYLKDIAEVKDSFKEQESFARLDKQNVITLNVVKKSGKNLIDAADNIKEIVKDLQANYYPGDLKVTLSGDLSKFTRSTLDELNNTILIGFLLVTLVLMFFMGFTNAFFVGLSVPISMCVAYLIMPGIGFTMNMMVMFSFIFALGIVVDDAIVVIENTHRIHRTQPNIVRAAKQAAGEVFLPVLSGTLTTLAPFFPLAFWPGVVGKLMYYVPVTLIITLFASLFVAYIINPVFAVSFMKHEYDNRVQAVRRKSLIVFNGILIFMAIIFHLSGWPGMGNLMIFAGILYTVHRLYGQKAITGFQTKVWPAIMRVYERTLRFFLRNRNPYYLFWSMVGLFVFTFVLMSIRKPRILFFPENEPNNIYVYINMPVGTDQLVTDSITREVEKRIYGVLGENNPIVESVISNVALGAEDEDSFERTVASHKGKISVNFVEYKYRHRESTTVYLDKIREVVKGIPGAEITVNKNNMGPPVGKPINIEISSEDIKQLVQVSKRYKTYLDSLQIPGIEELKSDFVDNKPEIVIDIDRERANREGIYTGQIAMEIRSAVFGLEVSKYKEGEDEFPIQLRYTEKQRENINTLMDLKITYRDMNTGMLRQIPLSSLARVEYRNTYGGIKRKDLKRVVTIYSQVLSGYTPIEVLASVQKATKEFDLPSGMTIDFTGENVEQEETTSFLSKAMLISLGLIFFILITQFNSTSKSIIILSEVVFSIIGVFLGYLIFGMTISILMTGLGIVALGGIVVRNGILIVEFTDVLKGRGLKTREAIVQAGKIRTTPVILTATATMLGLVPLAIGMNINFVTLFTELNPHLHFGGDNVMFFGPLSWTIIFGLSFSTFLTLVFVPIMYFIAFSMKARLRRWKSNRLFRRRAAE